MSSEGVIASARRKNAKARAYIKAGKGRFYFNGVPITFYPMEMAKLKIMEPLILAGKTITDTIDVEIVAEGGGVVGQADAARIALARALVNYTKNEDLKKIYESYDRTMLAGDHRRTEAEKWMRYSARRWRQKSYR